jgi:hypothetical protein
MASDYQCKGKWQRVALKKIDCKCMDISEGCASISDEPVRQGFVKTTFSVFYTTKVGCCGLNLLSSFRIHYKSEIDP